MTMALPPDDPATVEPLTQTTPPGNMPTPPENQTFIQAWRNEIYITSGVLGLFLLIIVGNMCLRNRSIVAENQVSPKGHGDSIIAPRSVEPEAKVSPAEIAVTSPAPTTPVVPEVAETKEAEKTGLTTSVILAPSEEIIKLKETPVETVVTSLPPKEEVDDHFNPTPLVETPRAQVLSEEPKKWKIEDGPPTDISDMMMFTNPPGADGKYYVYFFNDQGMATGEPIIISSPPYFIDVDEPARTLWTYTNGEKEISFQVPEGHQMDSAPELYENGTPKEFPRVVPIPHQDEKKFRAGYVGFTYVDPSKVLQTYISPCIVRYLISTTQRDDLLEGKHNLVATTPETAEPKQEATPATKPVVTVATPSNAPAVVIVSEPVWEPIKMQPWRDGNYHLTVVQLTNGGEEKEIPLVINGACIVKKMVVKKDGNIFDIQIAIEDKDGNLLETPGFQNPLTGVVRYCPLSPPRGYVRGSR